MLLLNGLSETRTNAPRKTPKEVTEGLIGGLERLAEFSLRKMPKATLLNFTGTAKLGR